LAALVTTLEALPALLALPPPAIAMALPHILHAVSLRFPTYFFIRL
jgi:hypothetical protein